MIRGKAFESRYVGNRPLLFRALALVALLPLAGCIQLDKIQPYNSVLQQDPILLWTKILSNAGLSAACLKAFHELHLSSGNFLL